MRGLRNLRTREKFAIPGVRIPNLYFGYLGVLCGYVFGLFQKGPALPFEPGNIRQNSWRFSKLYFYYKIIDNGYKPNFLSPQSCGLAVTREIPGGTNSGLFS
jgi:hypothetical protein